MGLDQFAFARKGDPVVNDDGQTEYPENHEIAYWRKHPNLQGWMEQLFISKGYSGEFNCVDLELNSADLDKLATDVVSGDLPFTEGFFFGEPRDHDNRGADLAFIAKAREYLSEGYKIIYHAWW